MPTFDSGRCFLTVLLPIKAMEVVNRDGICCSPVHMVRHELAVLPTARQSPITMKSNKNSPFTRNPNTHFARFVVIEDVVFNGRMPTNAIRDQKDRTIGRPVDYLPCPYLLFTADFDAPNGSQQELRAWLQSVWTDMRGDLEPILKHCHGYAGSAGTADSFADYIIGHQIETTMPFNDYWPGIPPLKSISVPLLIAAAIATALGTGAALYRLASYVGWPRFLWPWLYCAEVVAIVLLAIAGGAYVAYRWVMWHGGKPFPMAPHSDLPTVLKSLYLQRQTIQFAIDMQGKDEQTLYEAFGAFLKEHRIHDTSAKTQKPGVISNEDAMP
jgi:hypothetical protein